MPLSVFWALALQSVEDLQMHWYTRNEVIFDFSVGKALFFSLVVSFRKGGVPSFD